MKYEFISELQKEDELLYSALLGQYFFNDMEKGLYKAFDIQKLLNVYMESSLAGEFYPKDQQMIEDFIKVNYQKEVFDENDLLVITRHMLIYYNNKE